MLQLNQQITVTMAALNISKAELSRRLGHKLGYLNEMQRVGCSTEKQAELIAKIQRVQDGQVYMSDEQRVADLKNQLEGAKEVAKHNFNCANSLKKELIELKGYIEDQERHHKEIREFNTNIDIAYKTMHKTSQELAGRILELEGINDTIDTENDKLRETVKKQTVLIEQANWNTDFLAQRMPTTALAAFVLFIKILFGGKA